MNIDLNGAAYHVRDHGTGESVVVLLHGWPDDGDLWRHQVPVLVDAGYRVITPDLLGFGQSERHPDVQRYTGASLAADLLMMLDEMGIARCHLAAHDWGAVAGWEMVASAPDRFASYAALSVGHSGALFDLDHGKLSNLWYFLLAQTEPARELFAANDGAFMRFYLASHPQGGAIVDRMVAEPDYLEATRRIELAHPVGDILLAALTGQLPEPVTVAVPTLGLWGGQDELMWRPQIADSERFMEAQWRFEQIDEAGHWLMLDQPDKTADLLREWIEQHV
ncbi:MAG: alpha/beta hydrolase [Silicimonas sp.]|jgi:pimeloyl-ACP methyl ester carboxylesterase|uniref:alpha/beta fold hydrolase n=1 Tax=Roseitalea porphyridii TaxID=1852022 RepID=UPI0032ED31D9